jgi:hypothetical protein
MLKRGVELTHLEHEGWAVSPKKEAPSGGTRGFFGSFGEEQRWGGVPIT